MTPPAGSFGERKWKNEKKERRKHDENMGHHRYGPCAKENQDTYRISESNRVCVVCDGMGGAAGGCVASNLAAETYLSELEKVLKEDMTPEQLREASAYAVAMANHAVEKRAEADAELSNMGTTLVSAISYSDGVVISNVGDSRAYYVTETEIIRVTKDHSLVETMVDHGISPRMRRGIIPAAISSPEPWGGTPMPPVTALSVRWKAVPIFCFVRTGWSTQSRIRKCCLRSSTAIIRRPV